MSADPASASDLITLAFNTLGLYQVGESIPAGEMTTAFTRLKQMTSGWALLRAMAPVLGREVFPLTAGRGSSTNPYLIGPTGDFVTSRPLTIDGAGYLLPPVGGAVSGTEIRRAVLTPDAYDDIRQKDLPNLYFTGLYYEPQTMPPTGNGRIFLWPVPTTAANSLVLYRLEPLGQFASLTTTYLWPDGYSDLIHYQLARRLLTPYGISDPTIVGDVRDLAATAMATFQRPNTLLNDLELDPGTPGTVNLRGGFNIDTGTGG